MANGFFEELSALGSETNVDTDLLVEKVKSAMLKAARKISPIPYETLYTLLFNRKKSHITFDCDVRSLICSVFFFISV